jgi:hypothetical protein
VAIASKQASKQDYLYDKMIIQSKHGETRQSSPKFLISILLQAAPTHHQKTVHYPHRTLTARSSHEGTQQAGHLQLFEPKNDDTPEPLMCRISEEEEVIELRTRT